MVRVFLDTNIFKFSAVKKHVYAKRRKLITWGDLQKEIEYHVPYTLNDLTKIKTATQRRDAISLGMLALLGKEKRVEYFSHRVVDDEVAGLPSMMSPSGRFFGCPIQWVLDPRLSMTRVVCGAGKTHRQHTLEFLSAIKDERFKALANLTGAYQGEDKPLHLNQALDAYHLWCAESAQIEYFLTMDYKLARVVERNKQKTAIKIVAPQALLRLVMIQLGPFRSLPILIRAYRFAKRELAFLEGEGWN